MLSTTVTALVGALRPREQEVVSGRFGLAGGARVTLADLGARYGVTRERVRQIEREALRHAREIGAKKPEVKMLHGRIVRHLEGVGGVRREDLLLEELRRMLRDATLNRLHMVFLFELFGQPSYYEDRTYFHPVWHIDAEALTRAKRFIEALERAIASQKQEVLQGKKFNDYMRRAATRYGVSDAVALNYVYASRRFGRNPFGEYGLSAWEEIEPRTVRSRAYLVARRHGKPLHFRDIAARINAAGFLGRAALPQTVHNELIKDPRFILVGRGMYGLKERGFTPGTTRDIIKNILRREGPLPKDMLVRAMARERFLERNTILLALQNRKYFTRLPDGRYSMKRG